MSDVSADYEAGRWVPAWFGSRFVLAKRDAGIVREFTYHDATLRETITRSFLSEEDTSTIYKTLDEARAECERRNA